MAAALRTASAQISKRRYVKTVRDQPSNNFADTVEGNEATKPRPSTTNAQNAFAPINVTKERFAQFGHVRGSLAPRKSIARTKTALRGIARVPQWGQALGMFPNVEVSGAL